MIFGMFGSKKKQESLADLLAPLVAYQQMVDQISKAQSLQKLKRVDEARLALLIAEKVATDYLKRNPCEKKAHMMMALFHTMAGTPDLAEPIIARLLESGEFQLSDDERFTLRGDLQRIRRQRPLGQRAANVIGGFTTIYCCANCGRLHNFVSMPCPTCDWSPQTIEELARSMVLSNAHFNIPQLLILAREIVTNKRTPEDVVPNLPNDAKDLLAVSGHREAVEKVFSDLRRNEHKNHRSLQMVRECMNCGKSVLLSDSTKCDTCGAVVNWPDAVRTLICMDNLLWLFEQRLEVSTSEAFADFICVLVAMTNNLLRKQESPSLQHRKYSLKLLADVGMISDANKGAVVDTRDTKNLRLNFVEDSMRKDSKFYGTILFKELEFYVEKMIGGVRL